MVGIIREDGGDYEGRWWGLRQKIVGIMREDGGDYEGRWWGL